MQVYNNTVKIIKTTWNLVNWVLEKKIWYANIFRIQFPSICLFSSIFLDETDAEWYVRKDV